MIRREPSCEGFFRQAKQKPQEILDGFPRIFVKYDGNQTRSFGHEEYLEVPLFFSFVFSNIGGTEIYSSVRILLSL